MLSIFVDIPFTEPDIDLPNIENLTAIELNPLDIALFNNGSQYGSNIVWTWNLPPKAIELAPELVNTFVELLGDWGTFPTLQLNWTVRTLMWPLRKGLRRNLPVNTKRRMMSVGDLNLNHENQSDHRMFENRLGCVDRDFRTSMVMAKLHPQISRSLLTDTFDSCGVIHGAKPELNRAVHSTCLLKTTGTPANVTFRFSAQLCYFEGACGPATTTSSMRSNPIPAPPIQVLFTINRDPASKKLKAKASWGLTNSESEQKKSFDTLKHEMKALEILSTVVTNGKQIFKLISY